MCSFFGSFLCPDTQNFVKSPQKWLRKKINVPFFMQFSPKMIHELRFYKVLKFLEKYFEIHKFERFAFFIIIIFIGYNDECVVFWRFLYQDT